MKGKTLILLGTLGALVSVPALAAAPMKGMKMAPMGEQTMSVTVKDTKVMFGFMTIADFKKTQEASMWTPPAGSTHHIDVRFTDAKTGKDVKYILAVTVTVMGPKGTKESKMTMDMRKMTGHFCQGFTLKDKGSYQVSAAFQGKRNGTATVTYKLK